MDKVQHVIELIDKSSKTLNDISMRLDGFTNKSNVALNANALLNKSIGDIGGIVAGTFAVSRITSELFDFGKQSLAAAGQIEKYKVTLETMLGSKALADARMKEYSEIATKTPFELTEVVDAGNKLQSLGKYSEQNMLMLGDLAAASGKPFEQVLSAYSKLVTGQKGEAVNMFRDLLITGDDWMQATNKGITKGGELMATTGEMLNNLESIIKKKGFNGMMINQSKTMIGIESNLKDSTFQLQSAIGERLAPAYKVLLKDMGGVIGKMKQFIEIPVSEKIAEEKTQVNLLARELKDSETPLNRRNEIIAELRKIHPGLVDGLNAENISIANLNKNLAEYNRLAIRRMTLAKGQEEYDKIASEAGENLYQLMDYEQRLASIYDEANTVMLKIGATKQADAIMNAKVQQSITDIVKAMASGMYTNQTIQDVLKSKGFAIPIESISKIVALENERVAKMGDYQEAEKKAEEAKKKLDDLQKRLGLNENGSTNVTTTTTTTDGAVDPTKLLDKEINKITGDVKAQKVITINLNSLINNNTNMFDSGQNPADATDFMNKLTVALQSVVNDTNYSN